MSKLDDGDYCRSILGDDYMSPNDVVEAYEFNYSEDQLINFDRTLPDIETVSWLRSNNYMLIATPPIEMGLSQVDRLYTGNGYDEKHTHPLGHNDVVKAGEWLMMLKEPSSKSFSKDWDQQCLLPDKEVEYIPNIAEVGYAIATYNQVRNKLLLMEDRVRTNTINDNGNPVIIGSSKKDGSLVIQNYWAEGREEGIGILTARQH